MMISWRLTLVFVGVFCSNSAMSIDVEDECDASCINNIVYRIVIGVSVLCLISCCCWCCCFCCRRRRIRGKRYKRFGNAKRNVSTSERNKTMSEDAQTTATESHDLTTLDINNIPTQEYSQKVQI